MMMQMKRAAAILMVLSVAGAAGCARGCFGPKIGPDGMPVIPKELPRFKYVGEDFEVQPYERDFISLYGPFEAGRSHSIRFRLINKRYQAVDNAKFDVVVQPPGGDKQNDACHAKFEKEGIHTLICQFNGPAGEWDMKMAVTGRGQLATMQYGFYVHLPKVPPGDASSASTVEVASPDLATSERAVPATNAREKKAEKKRPRRKP